MPAVDLLNSANHTYDNTTSGLTSSYVKNAIDELAAVNVTTVAGLPSATPAGQRAFVTDSASIGFYDIVSGAGTNTVPVFSDGTNWRVG